MNLLGAIQQHAITWANVDLDQCRHIASQGHITNIYYRAVQLYAPPCKWTECAQLI